ncbi:hypothetical protein PHYBLDRAFT_144539 [Phycomyces blakesleeanus NRRL 1555(-)]|uniref:Uncharacterized protein n=1 Tax=Phycomyces blakesleeanus (strain ATCC 8743b / DSM 1359 / FGSC 10004 / NBRC 33097 / NRRL 1555) TaxID=763407 RepID=A0A167MUX6_PHYB8|nr:hypothetical protein PHYBLDRAFT_144539 [Phycomyces blakesleeanus NRRL 1555(-)]OAD74079.1 hypothetical protein PHYBLDRAFT_144539 [Phycomyces blakesleeanus NRRL 1555(-)]|eukprot:XP_018292119.1 hypothetical protein PHYBLDRAFT_144539 [Phycomyces blakesleeanus NRRL 1555(-)]
MTRICQIAFNSSDEYKSLLAKIKEMEKSMVDVRDELTMMHKAICAGFGQGNGSQTSASVSLDNLSVAASSIVRIPASIASEISCENKDKVFKLIRGYMRKDKFTFNYPALVSANEAKPRWETDVFFNRSPNKEIVANLLGYLLPKFVGQGIKTSEFRTMVHTNFRNTACKDREDPMVRAATNARGRRAARETEHFNCRVMAYVLNKDVIDALMKRNCSRLMIRSTMSEGESEDEFPGRPCKRIFNNLIFNIDEIVKENLGNNICQLLDRNLASLSEKPVPNDIALCFPPWTLRDGP